VNASDRTSPLAPNEVVVMDDVATPAEQSTLLAWAGSRFAAARMVENPADPGAWCSSFQSVHGGLTRIARQSADASDDVIWHPDAVDNLADRLPAELWELRRRVVALLALDGFDEDPYKGAFVSWIAPGTGVHTHRDARIAVDGEACLLLRCNVLLGRPPVGGQPVIEGHRLDVAERGMWAFFPSELVHSASAVGGDHHRGLASFGFAVRPGELWRRRYRLTAAFVDEYGLGAGEAAVVRLLDALGASPEASSLEALRHDVFATVVRAGDVSVEDVAAAVRRPEHDVWLVIRDLQRSAVVERVGDLDERCRILLV